jgi:hypothetical protein
MKIVVRQYNTIVKIVPNTTGQNKLVVSNTPTILKLVVRNNGGGTSSGGSVVVSVVAQENINIFDVVTGDGHRATSDNVQQRNRIVGIALAAITNGFSGNVQTVGAVINSAWNWNKGDKIFLNGYSLSTIAPTSGFSVLIGVATAANTIDILLQPSVLL